MTRALWQLPDRQTAADSCWKEQSLKRNVKAVAHDKYCMYSSTHVLGGHVIAWSRQIFFCHEHQKFSTSWTNFQDALAFYMLCLASLLLVLCSLKIILLSEFLPPTLFFHVGWTERKFLKRLRHYWHTGHVLRREFQRIAAQQTQVHLRLSRASVHGRWQDLRLNTRSTHNDYKNFTPGLRLLSRVTLLKCTANCPPVRT